MPMAIALLNGNTVPLRARFFGSRSAAIRGRGAGGVRRVALGLLDQLVPGIGRVGIGAAVLQARLEPVEFRRGRRHVGIGLSRGAVGLGGGAAEIVGIGGDVAETAHARRLRHGVVGPAAGRAGPFAGRRQLRILQRDRRRRRRLRPRRRQFGARVALGRGLPARAAAGRCATAAVTAAVTADAGGRAAGLLPARPAAPARPGGRADGCCCGRHRRRGRARRRSARPPGRAGRPRTRPCARPLPATAVRG